MPVVFDLHCDTPINIAKRKFNHIKPEKLRKQSYLGAIFAHFISPKTKDPFTDAVKLIISTIAYLTEKNSINIIHNYKELKKKKTNIILGVEGGHVFDKSFKQFEVLYGLDVRVFTITWNNSNKLAHSALDADKKGLTKKGKEFMKKLAHYDIIIDLSHASTRTVLDVCEVSSNPIIASHSCVRALNPRFLRNIADCAIEAIAKRGGVIGINFSRYHLGNYRIVDHLEYLKNNFCIDVAAIGSDFDGINDAVFSGPLGIKKLERELAKKGYKREEISKICYQNFLRVFKTVSQ